MSLKLQFVYSRCSRLQASSLINCYLSLVRYADDFLITGYSKELLEDEVKPLVGVFLQERGLTLSPERPGSRTSCKGSISRA